MLIHRVVVPAAVHFEAFEAGLLRNSLADLEQELAYCLRSATPQKLEPDILSIRAVKLDSSLFSELRD